MKLLALDPSSTRTGYALGTGPRTLIDAGLITGKGDAVQRCKTMRTDLRELILRNKPKVIIIEIPSGHTHGRIIKAHGLSIYGMAVGVILATCWGCCGKAVVRTIDQNTWTNQVKKKHRQQCVTADFPQYDPKADPGMDVSDAIGLMVWAYQQYRIEEAAA